MSQPRPAGPISLGGAALGVQAVDLDLPAAIPCRVVSLRERELEHRAGPQVRDAPLVTPDRHRANRAIGLTSVPAKISDSAWSVRSTI